MAIDLNVPQSLMQHKSYKQVALTGDRRFVFEFNEYDERIYDLRVIRNSRIVPENEYSLTITSNEIIVIFNNYVNVGDIIHLDVFIPLNRYNEYSICIIDYTTVCEDSVNTYPLEYKFYNIETCKFQIIHSRLGFISKEKYVIKDENIVFDSSISFVNGDLLYVKVIQDGAKLLQVKPITPDRIVVKKQPNKTSYCEGDYFEIDGMELEIIYNGGVSSLIVDVEDIIIPSNPLTLDDNSVVVKYFYQGITYEVVIPIDVDTFKTQFTLIDFNFIDNGNDTYTLTEWKGTLNGIPSTELVIPNNKRIIL